MKKWLALVLALVLLSSASFSAIAEPFSFRNGVTFGMTREEIIACEGAEPHNAKEDNLHYSAQKSAGKNCAVSYSLSEGKLYKIIVLFTDDHSFENLYIDDFDTIDEALQTKYGKPLVDTSYVWLNDLYKDNPQEHGFAVSAGHLAIMSQWLFDDFQIAHALLGDNFEINHAVMYQLNEIKEQVNTDGI